MPTDIWPELDLTSVARTPRTVLLEQSELLKKKTAGLLDLYVKTESGQFRAAPALSYRVSLYASKLSYHAWMLAVTHAVDSPYPALVADEGGKEIDVVASEDEFVRVLSEYVALPRWIETSNRLLAMSKAS